MIGDQALRYASRNSDRAIPDCEQIVRSVDAFRVVWFGIVSGVRLPSAFCRAMKYAVSRQLPLRSTAALAALPAMSLIPFAPFTLPNNLEAQRLQRAKYFCLRRVDREFHPLVSDASVIEASITSS